VKAAFRPIVDRHKTITQLKICHPERPEQSEGSRRTCG
jgi:hypothetical protein